ncbi:MULTISPECIES: DUF6402 family protein [unclassified Caballeronia]|uniref:DUF6402 family protein n=1 Tax=unclassified Caballeronia TaxID=2646786 RepID=UPI00285D4DBB|nr:MULTISPECIES: DUF6402 family protein [unclassified Caballeronia]MDR5740531.1 DUF6402 family protein [Caballeronia sp. LZ016]MDR5808948.1 DUF6402 family protein [Caballeronia sp. LZ019]
MQISDVKIPYYSSDILRRWKRRDSCKLISGLDISFLREPPVCEFHVTPPPPPTPVEKPDRVIAFLDGLQKVHDFLHEPPKKRPPPPPKPAKQVKIPPFDLQEIPGAMRAVNMPVAAQLMERWFAGGLNYSPTNEHEGKLINQDGKPYPPSMYEMSLVKLDWVLKFERAREGYERLLSREVLSSPLAIATLRTMIEPFRRPDRQIFPRHLTGNSLAELHKHFQFQYSPVEGSMRQKIAQFMHREYAYRGLPDDLTGALGSFNFYVAPESVVFSWDGCDAEIRTVIVYVKDNYTFGDKPGQVSQYLGHWNRSGVIIVPYSAALSALNWHREPPGDVVPLPEEAGLYADFPVAVADPRTRGNVYHPVYNSTYRKWQITHKRGGDFVIFSDSRTIKLVPPIKVRF